MAYPLCEQSMEGGWAACVAALEVHAHEAFGAKLHLPEQVIPTQLELSVMVCNTVSAVKELSSISSSSALAE